MRTLTCLLPLLLTATAAGQNGITFLRGASPTSLELAVVDESNPGAAPRIVLSQLEVLPLEITNRTAALALRTDRPRVLAEHGVPRLELPQGGRLLRYRRAAATRYGFVWIDGGGNPAVLLELPGAAPGGIADPFKPKFGIAPDGLHAAFVTQLGALRLARLDGQPWASTGSPVRAIPSAPVEPLSVCVGPTHVFFQTEDNRLWRCSLADGSVPENVTPAMPLGARFKEEMAPSGDGTAVAFLMGPQRALQLWLLRSQGPATALPPPPSEYEEPGYLPEEPLGPRMLLDETGSRLLYTDSVVREEIYLLDTTGATATTHITSDPNFVPYIGIGVLPAFIGQTVFIAIGDPAALDWYTASTGTPGVLNLTNTGPRQIPPFEAGTLSPSAAYPEPQGPILVEEADGSGGTRLRRIDPATSSTTIVYANLRKSPEHGRGTGNLLVATHGGDFLLSPALAPLVAAPAGIWLSADDQGPVAGLSVCIVSLPAGPSGALFLLPGGGLLALSIEPQLRQARFTPGAGLLFNGTRLLYFGPAGAAVLSGPANILVALS